MEYVLCPHLSFLAHPFASPTSSNATVVSLIPPCPPSTDRHRFSSLPLSRLPPPPAPPFQDNHSRRGLEAMLSRRRKLLKYLRRRDWEAYCHTILQLGLRDRVDAQR